MFLSHPATVGYKYIIHFFPYLPYKTPVSCNDCVSERVCTYTISRIGNCLKHETEKNYNKLQIAKNTMWDWWRNATHHSCHTYRSTLQLPPGTVYVRARLALVVVPHICHRLIDTTIEWQQNRRRISRDLRGKNTLIYINRGDVKYFRKSSHKKKKTAILPFEWSLKTDYRGKLLHEFMGDQSNEYFNDEVRILNSRWRGYLLHKIEKNIISPNYFLYYEFDPDAF